jgi:hypothetical protein
MRALSAKLLILVALICPITRAQFSNWTSSLEQQTQAQGYWTDPSRGLIWASRDNGKRVSWHNAMKYCRNLRLAGNSDWRLATIDELESLVNLQAYATEHVGSSDILHWNTDLHVNGGLMLTDDRQWSSSPLVDPNPQVSKTHFWGFDYRVGRRRKGFEDWAEGDTMRALCVRDAKSAQSTAVRQ